MKNVFDYTADEMRREIDDLLSSVGILFRVFSRGKDKASLESKLLRTPGKYHLGGRLVQDAIGIRVALYFQDDISVVKSLLESKFQIDDTASTVDHPGTDQFCVTRYNLVFRLPSEAADRLVRDRGNQPIDSTFEVQLRSILSEGWHEVEHDLRYKVKESWNGHDDLSRALNGIFATLETSEWSMGKIFDDMAYRHYRNRNWKGMLPNLLRMRLKGAISDSLIDVLNTNTHVAKELLRVDRQKLLKALSGARPKIPVTSDNVILFWNAIGPLHNCLTELTPELISDAVRVLRASDTGGSSL